MGYPLTSAAYPLKEWIARLGDGKKEDLDFSKKIHYIQLYDYVG